MSEWVDGYAAGWEAAAKAIEQRIKDDAMTARNGYAVAVKIARAVAEEGPPRASN